MLIYKFSLLFVCICARKLRSVDRFEPESNSHMNSIEYIWASTTVAVGDTAVLHCSFDAIFQQLRNGNIDWYRELTKRTGGEGFDNKIPTQSAEDVSSPVFMTSKRDEGMDEWEIKGATLIASGKKLIIEDNRFRVYRPHNSALSVLIVRKAKKKDAGIYRCNLSSSSTRHRYMILNVTESKIEAQTSPATMRVKLKNEATLWCNATGYPKPVVYWTREDRNRKLPDGSYQFWSNGLHIQSASEADTGIYACFLDNYVQPVVSYKFSVIVEDNPWVLDGYKMRYDSKQWNAYDNDEPKPVRAKSFLLMCETKGATKPLPLIRWYRDGKSVRNNKHFYIIEDAPESKFNYASSTLIIMNFLPRYHANYTCVASNVFRMKKLTFYIRDFLESELDELQPPVKIAPSHRLEGGKPVRLQRTSSRPVDISSKVTNRMNVKEIFIRHQKLNQETGKLNKSGLTTALMAADSTGNISTISSSSSINNALSTIKPLTNESQIIVRKEPDPALSHDLTKLLDQTKFRYTIKELEHYDDDDELSISSGSNIRSRL